MRPLGLLQKVFDLGGRGAGRVGWWLMRVATGIIQRVPWVLLLQSWVVEKVVVNQIASCVMGVRSRWVGASMVGGGG